MMHQRPVAVLLLSAVIALLTGPSAHADETTTKKTTTSSSPSAAEVLEDEALSRLMAWKLNAARQLLDRKREQLGDTPEFRVPAGFLAAQEGRPDDALSALGEAAAALPGDPAPAYLRGEVLYAWKDRFSDAQAAWGEARRRAEASLKLDADDPRARFYLGAALVRLQRYDDARSALDTALANGFDAVLVHYQRGLSLAFAKKWEPAVQAFDEVISRDDRFAYAYYFRGLSWKQRGRTDKMLNDLDRFVSLAPNAPDVGTAKALLSAAGR